MPTSFGLFWFVIFLRHKTLLTALIYVTGMRMPYVLVFVVISSYRRGFYAMDQCVFVLAKCFRKYIRSLCVRAHVLVCLLAVYVCPLCIGARMFTRTNFPGEMGVDHLAHKNISLRYSPCGLCLLS